MKDELLQLGGGAHALAIQILGNRDDAQDAVQEAFATVFGRPETYDSAKGPLKPWFLRIVRNRCIDILRKRRPAPADPDTVPDSAAGPERSAEIAERDRAIETALRSLDADQRQIVVLRDYLDLSYAEIADVLAIPAGTVMSRLHRARVALGKAYREHND